MSRSNSFDVELGLTCTSEYVVEEGHAAKHVGSGEVGVLSTPSMILFIERTAMSCVQSYLPPGYTTVGTLVSVKHLNPAPVNGRVVVETKVVGVEGRKIVFEARVLWGKVLVGEGVHERYVVNSAKFAEKLAKLIEENK